MSPQTAAEEGVITQGGRKFKTFGPIGRATLDVFACRKSMTRLSDFVSRTKDEVVHLHVLGAPHDHEGPFTPESIVLVGRVDGRYGSVPIRLACLKGHSNVVADLNGLSL